MTEIGLASWASHPNGSLEMPPSKSARRVARARITELDSQINALQLSVQALSAERASCETLLDTYKYPLLHLPNEIISEIFLNFLPSPPERPPAVGPLSPSFLAQICRKWRDIAFSTPSMWSALQLNLDRRDLRGQQLYFLQTWLERSKDCLLSIALECSGAEFEDDIFENEMGISTFVKAIVRHCARWADMTLILPAADLRLVQGDMPQLRNLTFGPHKELDPDAPEAARVVAFDRAPNLTNVILSTCFSPFIFTFTWSQIITLAGCLYDDETVEVLRHTTSLQDCTLRLCTFIKLTLHTMVPALLHLTSLKIVTHMNRCCDEATIHLLDSLTLPALQRLHFDENILGIEPDLTIPSFMAFMSRIRDLKLLEITNSAMPQGFYRAKIQGSGLEIIQSSRY
ncbi:hypothetical protein DFH09DRAFT_1355027 [Mycena vulgaris]|nr:hypothetical protein DFH09DRAFT_1355027 [Mycena vulgaris]